MEGWTAVPVNAPALQCAPVGTSSCFYQASGSDPAGKWAAVALPAAPPPPPPNPERSERRGLVWGKKAAVEKEILSLSAPPDCKNMLFT